MFFSFTVSTTGVRSLSKNNTFLFCFDIFIIWILKEVTLSIFILHIHVVVSVFSWPEHSFSIIRAWIGAFDDQLSFLHYCHFKTLTSLKIVQFKNLCFTELLGGADQIPPANGRQAWGPLQVITFIRILLVIKCIKYINYK